MSIQKFKEKLPCILEMLNEEYCQDSENYTYLENGKQTIIRYDDETVISLWACGAIVCVNSIMYFIQEDDGYWFCPEYIDKEDINEDGLVDSWSYNHARVGMQSTFSVGWIDSFTKAMKKLKDYLKEHGTPVYYSRTDKICHYTL